MNTLPIVRVAALLLLAAFCLLPSALQAQGTAFTYQGRLTSNGAPANGSYDFSFSVFDAATGGTQQGASVTNTATLVTNGLFTAALDFGAVFPGDNRWLDISVRSNGVASFTSLGARQPLTASPYAITAGGVPAGAITAGMLGASAVTSDKIAPGAVKGSQIDDAGAGDYQAFQSAAATLGGDTVVPFQDLTPLSQTNGFGAPKMEFLLSGTTIDKLVGFSGTTAMSTPPAYFIQALISGGGLDPSTYLGQQVELRYYHDSSIDTLFRGTVTACTVSGSTGSGQFYNFRVECMALRNMALSTDYQFFQRMTAPAVANYLLTLQGVTMRGPQTSHSAYEYLTQYGETTLNFFSRILENEGIFYFVSDLNVLTLGDSTGAYDGSGSTYNYYGENTNLPPGAQYIRRFQKAAHQSTLRSVVDAYDYQRPTVNLQQTNTGTAGTGETYEFGRAAYGGYTALLAQAREQRQAVERALLEGTANVPTLRAGLSFTLADQTSAGLGGSYAVTAVHHSLFVRVTNGSTNYYYGNHFEAIPSSLTYRPELKTPRPLALPTTAVVTSSNPDSYGNIQVLFQWDRHFGGNAWLRMTTPMAGTNHAMIFLPHAGDEVLVTFLQGDPDQPLITGSLYNGGALPPYALPGNKAVSTIRSGPSDSQVNELKFDDTAGAQLFSLRAAKDMTFQANSNLTIVAGNKTSISGQLSVATLAVNGGTSLANLQAGQVIAGSSTNGTLTVTITFPKAFGSTPKIMAMAHNDPGWSNVSDTFVATVRSATTTGCVLNLVRVDSANGWSQQLRVDWWAWE